MCLDNKPKISWNTIPLLQSPLFSSSIIYNEVLENNLDIHDELSLTCEIKKVSENISYKSPKFQRQKKTIRDEKQKSRWISSSTLITHDYACDLRFLSALSNNIWILNKYLTWYLIRLILNQSISFSNRILDQKEDTPW